MAQLTDQQKSFLKSIIRPVKSKLMMAWGCTVIAALIFVAQSWLLAQLFAGWLQDAFANQPIQLEPLWHVLPWLFLCFIARPLLHEVRQWLGLKASLTVTQGLRQRLIARLASLGPAKNQYGSDGSLSSQILEQTDALQDYVQKFSVQKMTAVSTPIILLIAAMSQSVVASLVLLLTAPLVPIFMILIGHATARKSRAQFAALAQLSGRFLDWVRGMNTLKRLQATGIAEQDIAHSAEQYRRRTMDVLKIAFLNSAVLEFLAALSIALVAVYLGFGLMGILPWQKNEVPVPYMSALFILLLAPEFYAPLRQLGADYHAKAQAEGAAASLLPLLGEAQLDVPTDIQANKKPDIKADIKAGIKGQTFDTTSSQIMLALSHAPTIQLQNVAITAMGRQRLAPFSLTVASGRRIAIVGASGSGKSSLLQALLGFSDFSGSITLDDISLKQLDMPTLREQVGYLAQSVALLPISIADNLRLAKPDASDAQLIAVLESVQMWSLVSRLPAGLETVLGERGSGLSGGQQQRLAIAQLLLREAHWWLLDEPTEHLDPDTAAQIHQLLNQVSQGKTVIWVTHAVHQLPWLDEVVSLTPETHHGSRNISNNANPQDSNSNINADTQSGDNIRDETNTPTVISVAPIGKGTS